jgi:DNA-binding NtrC family response regulator
MTTQFETLEPKLAMSGVPMSVATPAAGLYDRILREVERPLLSLSLLATRGNQIKAAEVLGINRNTLRKKMRALGIDGKLGWKHAA